MPFNPNRRPFPRESVIRPFAALSKIHPLRRDQYEASFKAANPLGYQHDLGAQDIFLDNFGMLFSDQFIDGHEYGWHCGLINGLLGLWAFADSNVIQKKPWWGKNLNIHVRRANAGEPRGLLRLFPDGDLGRVRFRDLWDAPRPLWEEESLARAPEDAWEMPLFRDGRLQNLRGFWPHEVRPPFPNGFDRFQDWDGSLLLPDGGFPKRQSPPLAPFEPGGIILPATHPSTVPELRILHPREATPDLPLRVGTDVGDLSTYGQVARDQENLPTCAAHAVAAGLDVALRRARGGRVPLFSPAWIHCRSGEFGGRGRSLRSGIGAVKSSLPCRESVFPYGHNREVIRQLTPGSPPWETSAIQQDSSEMTARHGQPWIRELDVRNIARMKAHLAAGWVIALSTSLTQSFWGPGLQEFGMPVAPLIGEARMPTGHAWLLVGYEHVDGNQSWKYQGRFVGLTFWGPKAFPSSPRGRGIVSIPFATLLTEGLEAFAFRFP